MGESAAPFGENEKKRSASRVIFAFPTGSPAYFSTHISLLLVLSKFQIICWCGNNLAKRKLSTQMIKIKSAKSAMEMGNSVYEIILTKYKNGIVDNIAYLDALSKKTINRALYIQALNNYEIAKANYYFTSGIDYEKVLKMDF